MKAGVSTSCLYPMHVEDALENLVKAGVNNTEIFLNTHSELDEKFIRKLKSTLENYNASCISLHPFTCELDNMMFFSLYERRLDDALEYHKRYFNAMNILGSKIFVFHGNKNATPVSPEFYTERFNRLCLLGKSFGITVTHENVARCQCRSLDFMQKLVKINPDIKFTLDIKQCLRAGENPFQIAEKIGGNIAHVHISDNSPENDCLKIGAGTFDISAFLSILKLKGFDGSVIIELYRKNFNDINDLYNGFNIITERIDKI